MAGGRRIKTMSMINEFVKKLRLYVSEYNKSPLGREIEGTSDLLKEAADIIEELSAKLASANMDRSEKYYKGNSEFVSKLIEQISKKKEYHKDFYEKMGCTEHDKDLHKATQLAFDECMEIVGELSKEYKSNGWIPVSEKLPDDYDNRFYMCIVENHEEDLPMFCQYAEDYGFGYWNDIYDEDSLGFLDSEFKTNDELGYEKVIAWQPLPQPYKGE